MITILYNFEMKKLYNLYKRLIRDYKSAMISIEQAQKLNLEY